MSSDEHELPRRAPESLLAEADYWRAILDDLQAINVAVHDGATAACDVPIALLELLLTSDPTSATDKARTATRTVLSELERIGSYVERLGELAEGRLIMLRREGGLDE